jgi:hypothetical protein
MGGDEARLPYPGEVITTACGGLIHYTPGAAQVIFRGQRIFFCLASCKEAFEQDPKSSCLVCNPAWEDEL